MVFKRLLSFIALIILVITIWSPPTQARDCIGTEGEYDAFLCLADVYGQVGTIKKNADITSSSSSGCSCWCGSLCLTPYASDLTVDREKGKCLTVGKKDDETVYDLVLRNFKRAETWYELIYCGEEATLDPFRPFIEYDEDANLVRLRDFTGPIVSIDHQGTCFPANDIVLPDPPDVFPGVIDDYFDYPLMLNRPLGCWFSVIAKDKAGNYGKLVYPLGRPQIKHTAYTKINVITTGPDLKKLTVKGTCPVIKGPSQLKLDPKTYPVRTVEYPSGIKTLEEFIFKVNTPRPCWWFVEVEDVAGQKKSLDPVVTKIRIRKGHTFLRSVGRNRGTRRIIEKSFRRIPGFEQYVTVINKAPGIRALRLIVNGERYTFNHLKANETRYISIGKSMRPGLKNRIIIRAIGKPKAGARIIVADQFF